MKSITEFANITLNKGLATKAALTAEGKSPEEIEVGLGTAFKLEGEKLKYFVNALTVAGENQTNLKRIFVVSLAEGENPPAKATKVDELHYVPEFLIIAKPGAGADKGARGAGKGGGRGGRGGGDRKGGSPWGMSPEELAAKKNKGAGGAKPS